MAIIADDASAKRALGRFLRGAGFEPTGFDSAESFLADERRSSFGCVLLDAQLKGMSGLELQRQLLAVGDRTPLIFITARSAKTTDTRTASSSLALHNPFNVSLRNHSVLDDSRAHWGL